MATKPIPDGFTTITPHLVVRGADRAIAFYKKAFGAEELMRMPGPDGQTVMHCELKIGDSLLMICEEMEHCKSPQALSGSPVTIHLYVPDVDRVFNQAVAAGAAVEMPVMDAFWGDRYGKMKDPFGHQWSVATHTRDLTPEEMQKGLEQFFSQQGGCQ